MKETLKDLLQGTIMTGQISEVHIKNLKAYPFIFLAGVEEVEISYDISTMSESLGKSKISFAVKFRDGFTEKQPENCEYLKKAVRILMQHDVEVSVTSRDIGAQVESGS
jgi:hypothetical protein